MYEETPKKDAENPADELAIEIINDWRKGLTKKARDEISWNDLGFLRMQIRLAIESYSQKGDR